MEMQNSRVCWCRKWQ